MFFTGIIEQLGNIPNYFVEDLLDFKKEMKFDKDNRNLLARGTTTQTFMTASPAVKMEITNIVYYILSQQYTVLKNCVPIETALIQAPNLIMEAPLTPRYICRAGEQIVLPLNGSISINSSEFKKTEVLTPGTIYRINNRVPATMVAEEHFLALTIMFLDFDLKKYLLPHDLNSPFTRQKDEFVDPSKAKLVEDTKYSY